MKAVDRNFQGIWIPKLIYLNTEVNWYAKILFLEDSQLYGKWKRMLYVEQIHFVISENLRATGFPIHIRTKDNRLD